MKFHRMISILLTIENKGKVTAKELAGQLEISTRTVYRDIDALCESGIPIITESGPNGGISLMKGYQTEIKHLEKDDIIYLYLHGMGIKADSKSEIAVKSNISIQKLDKLICKEGLDISSLKNRFYIDDSPWWKEQKSNNNNIDSIIKSVLECRKIHISYKKVNGEVTKRTIRPYGIVVKDTEWYLTAYCESSYDLRIFKCERIMECQLTIGHFLIPDSFKLKDYFQTCTKSFESQCRESEQYHVTLRIPSQNIDLIKNCEVYISQEKDSDLEVTMNMYSYRRAKTEFWDILIHSYIVEPIELRDYVFSLLQTSYRRYEGLLH